MYETKSPYEIGETLKELRGKRTVEVAAKGIGVTASALGNYENGIRVPRDEAKVKLANFYNCSIESIFFKYYTHEM